MKIIAVYNIKGGVGKTATAVNLAYLSARAGYRTLVWDLDPQAAATFYFRVKPKVKKGKRILHGKGELDAVVKATDFENLDLLPADFSYRNMDRYLNDAKKPPKQLLRLLRPLGESYDTVFLDCPPSISLASENIFNAADALLIPLIPTTLSLRTLRQLLDFLHQKQLDDIPLMPFYSMVDRRKRMHTDIIAQAPDPRVASLSNWIPYASDIERMGLTRMPVGEFAGHGVAWRAYEALWREVNARIAG